MTADAIFPLEPVKAGFPALPVELPAQGRGNGDAAALDPHEYAFGRLLQLDADIPADPERCEKMLPQELEALNDGELQRPFPQYVRPL